VNEKEKEYTIKLGDKTMSTFSDEIRKITAQIQERDNEDIAAIAHALNGVRIKRGIPYSEFVTKTKTALEAISDYYKGELGD
jgi:hypothetical protein